MRPKRLRSGKLRSSELDALERRGRRRLAWRFGVAFLICLSVALLLRALLGDPEAAHHGRTTLSARADGFRGVFDVLDRLGFETRRNRRSYAYLPPPDESVLVVLDPLAPWTLRETGVRVDQAQVRLLRNWVEKGGRLLGGLRGRNVIRLYGMEVDLEGAGDDPRCRGGWCTGGILDGVVEGMLEGAAPETEWAAFEGTLQGEGSLRGRRAPWRAPPRGKETLVSAYVSSPGRLAPWSPEAETDGPPKVRYFERDVPGGLEPLATVEGRPLVLRGKRGEGEIVLLSTCYPFSNLAVAETGTAPFLATLLHEVSEGGRRALVFDEYSHGLWQRRGIFGWVWQTSLAYPAALLLVLVALAAWRGGVRLGPPRREREARRRAKEEYVISLADIAQRGERRRWAALRIVESYRQRLGSSRRHLASGEDDEPHRPSRDPFSMLETVLRCERELSERSFREFVAEGTRIYREEERRRKGSAGQ